MLKEHFKKYKISPGAGGIRFLADLTEYKETSKNFQNEKVFREFECLNELARLFFVTPDNFKKVLLEGKLVNFKKEEIVVYLKLRKDFQNKWLTDFL